jgi:hypothetical protein
MRPQRPETRLTDDERRLDGASATEAGDTGAHGVHADQQTIALNPDEAAHVLNALETVDHGTVARLRELRDLT